MKLAIMQPYFFPYLGYFQLLNEADRFVLFDTPQFIRHGWIERNNVLKPNGERLYVKVPLLKHSRNTSIKNVVINNEISWKDKILAQIIPYKKKAPCYNETLALIKNCFDADSDSIVVLNALILKKVCKELEINTPIDIWSEMNLDTGDINAPDEWALQICNSMNAKEYLNPIGGKEFFDTKKYAKENIKISFLQCEAQEYKQFGKKFVPYLSIIDLLMFCGKKEVKSMLNKFSLIS